VAHAFYVEDANPKGALRSIQLFDAAGVALWKIYARDKADHAAFDQLLADLAWPVGVEAMPFTRQLPATAAGAPDHRPTNLQGLLEDIAAHGLPVELRVANHGIAQSHRGPLMRIVRMGPWLNVLDPGFDWHLNESVIRAAVPNFGGEASLTLHLADGSEAARLTASADASTEQKTAWRGVLEKAVAS
jgi:putative hemin transport protein